MGDSIQMSVSPICTKDGKKYAFIQFTDGKRLAEGKIPSCEIVSNQGFTKEETEQLSAYMKEHLADLKRMAAGLNAFEAIRRS